MVLGSTLLLAIVAAGLGALARWVVLRLGAVEWLAFWIGLTIALWLFAVGPIQLG